MVKMYIKLTNGKPKYAYGRKWAYYALLAGNYGFDTKDAAKAAYKKEQEEKMK